MGNDKWANVIKFLNSRPKATPHKVLNMLKTTYSKKSGSESNYQVVRNSWAYIVVGAIANKTGTKNKDKKIPTTQIIRNWIKTKQFKEDWCLFHPKKVKNKKLNRTEWNASSLKDCEDIHTERHVKQINDIWVSTIGKKIRATLTPSGKFPLSGSFGKNLKKLSDE
tara:strand:+ start:1199 stop:1696 length:498 start_codon:yes stop_codon:yes gene_type:complete